MAHYVGLYKWTELGRKNLKDSPDRLTAARQAAEKVGVKLDNVLYTMGEFDLVAMFEAPNDEAVVKFAAAVNATGAIQSQTMRAFTPEEFKQLTSAV